MFWVFTQFSIVGINISEELSASTFGEAVSSSEIFINTTNITQYKNL